MPLQIVRNDITKMKVDAIVNSTNSHFTGTGGADYAIHQAAGKELDEECSRLKPLEAGDAVMTPGYNLPCRYIVHTVTALWEEGIKAEAVLAKCYASCLRLAKEKELKSIAFPLISSGACSCPKGVALQISMDAIRDFLLENEMDVYIVVYDGQAFQLSANLLAGVKEYIDDVYVDAHEELSRRNSLPRLMFAHEEAGMRRVSSSKKHASLDSDFQFELDESFSEMLLRKIDESGMKDSECYTAANVSRQVFSKIRSGKSTGYIPTKTTILAFAIALHLDVAETRSLLEKAGYALSHSQLLDVIVEHCIKTKLYDVYKVNAILFQYDQMLLGTKG